MANIEKRTTTKGETTYRAKVRLKGYPIQSATFERLGDARKWAQATEAAIREGRHFKTTEAKRHTLGEMVDRYIREILPSKPKDAATTKHHLAWWKDQLGDYVLADVTAPRIAECRDKLATDPLPPRGKNNKPDSPPRYRGAATVLKYMALLSHAFTIAVKEWQWLEHNPMQKVSKPTAPRGRVRFLSDDERDRLMAACKQSTNKDLYLAVVLALSTGARQQEIMGLKWSQVDFKRSAITLYETKNGEIRTLPLVSHAHDLMQGRSKVRRIDTDLVFPSSNTPNKPVDLRTPWETALKNAGVEDFRWHDLRHSCASYLAMNGASLAEIAEVLGHKTLQMVKRYAHLSHAHTSKVVESMNAKIFG
jgi:integrase